MSESTLAEKLADCLRKSIVGREFLWHMFFQNWFRDKGMPCYFLFRKHLGITNMQYVELLGLLRTHCKDAHGEEMPVLLFHSAEHVKRVLTEAIAPILELDDETRIVHLNEFAETYIREFSATVIVDLFYSSSAVFLPPDTSLNINQVCADAGYIFCAGRSVFVRRLAKASPAFFQQGFKRYLRENKVTSDSPVTLMVYAHESFADDEGPSEDEMSQGAGFTKMHLDKMASGSRRLVHVLEDVCADSNGKLVVALDNLKRNHDTSTEPEQHVKPEKTLWLVCDRSMKQDAPTEPGNNRYYICYEQWVKNENPFFLFDENKPAWKSHTTLPHTLAAALLNATRPFESKAAICDPFGGTGTTWLEGVRLGHSGLVRTTDSSPISPQLVNDNLDFFCKENEALKADIEALRVIRSKIQPKANLYEQDAQEIPGFHEAHALLLDLIAENEEEDQEFDFNPSQIKLFHSLEGPARSIFYLLLRARLRYGAGEEEGARMSWGSALIKTVDGVLKPAEAFAHIRDQIEKRHSLEGNYLLFQGRFSKSVAPAILSPECSRPGSAAYQIDILDATKLAQFPQRYDIIICDPPYGFNTSENEILLARLYSEFLDAALQALKDRGHLIICLPEESYTGRRLPYCTSSHMVASQVLTKARLNNKRTYIPARSLPSQVFVPPYYWESQKALRRVILHFRFQDESLLRMSQQ